MTTDRQRPDLNFWSLLSIGMLNLVSLLVGFGLGWFVDGQLGSFPVCTLAGLALGIVAGVSISWFQVRSFFVNRGSS